ncbi:LuxR family transcriptional regulator [Lutibacter sp.]|uniref:LuxR family transcriptional regulator n=1 Tax=Lutibacter sp. TaxID=1925666 RepID=UPI003567B489
MALTKQPNLYPGMNDAGFEFFIVEDEVKFIANSKISNFTELPFGIIQIIEEEIENNKAIKMALLDWYPNSKYDRLKQFVKCRFGGLDFEADIINHQLQPSEYVECPIRSKCEHNGVLCKAPEYNGSKLNAIDIQLMKLLTTPLTNEVIAEQLNLPLGSYHKYKKLLYEKLGFIQTKQELTIIAITLNII